MDMDIDTSSMTDDFTDAQEVIKLCLSAYGPKAMLPSDVSLTADDVKGRVLQVFDTSVMPQDGDLHISDDNTAVTIDSSSNRLEYRIVDADTEEPQTDWRLGDGQTLMFNSLDATKNYILQVRTLTPTDADMSDDSHTDVPPLDFDTQKDDPSAGGKGEIVNSKTLPMADEKTVVAVGEFDEDSGCARIIVTPWSAGSKYIVLNIEGDARPLTAQELEKWNVKVFDADGNEIALGEDGYYTAPDKREMKFIVPAGGIYLMGGKTDTGEEFHNKRTVITPSVGRNVQSEYFLNKEKTSMQARFIVDPACPSSEYMAQYGRFGDTKRRYRVKPGKTKLIVPRMILNAPRILVTAIPIPLDEEGVEAEA